MLGHPYSESRVVTEWRTGKFTPEPDEAPRAPEAPPPRESASSRLKRFALSLEGLNVAMAATHALLLIIVCAAGDFGLHLDVFTVDLLGSNLSKLESMSPADLKAVVDKQPVYLTPKLRVSEALSLPATFLTATFFAVTAAFHIGNAVIWNEYYRACISRCMCPYRWIEYVVTAPIMILVIAYSAGVVIDLELALLAALMVVTIACGHLTEVWSRPAPPPSDRWDAPLRTRALPHAIGFLAQAAIWIAIIARFSDNASDAPGFVVAIVVVEVLLFISFGFVQLTVLFSRPSMYVRGEVAYVLLSLVSKAVLGGILIASVLHFRNWECAMEDVRQILPEGHC